MKRLFFFALLTVLILGLISGCDRSPAPTVADEPMGPPYQFKSVELENYVIVYAQNNPDYADLANQLADHIFEKYDVFLTTTLDTASPSAQYEIFLDDTGRIMEYAVTVEDGKLMILTGGSFSAEQAINHLCEQVFTGQDFALDIGKYYQTSFLTKSQPITENTTARVMSANVLADAFADSSYQNAYYRAEIFAGMLISYTPDVLGLQETDENWNKVLDDYLTKIQNIYGITYARHLATYQDKVNYTSLLYRTDRFKVDTDGVNVFNWWTDKVFNHNYHMRNISWAQFSSLDDPSKTMIVANTHWSYRTEHSGGNTFLAGSDTPIAVDELRMQCQDETNTFMATLRQAHPETPVFLTGDFNTSLPFFTQSGWTPTDFKLISEEAVNSGKSLALVPASGHFDHIFGTGNYSIHLFSFIKDANHHELLTDHPFVYADLAF